MSIISTIRSLVMSTVGYQNARARRRTSENSTAGLGLEEKLRSALEDLKQNLNLGYELRVKWVPSGEGKLSGEVKGDCIYVYEETEKEALSTLRHEFLDYAISNVVEPYRQVTNKLIALINEEAYRRKERLVEKLSTLLPEF
jgi:hypothetical protein